MLYVELDWYKANRSSSILTFFHSFCFSKTWIMYILLTLVEGSLSKYEYIPYCCEFLNAGIMYWYRTSSFRFWILLRFMQFFSVEL